MHKRYAAGLLAGMLAVWGPVVDLATAACQVETVDQGSQGPFKTHLGADCTEEERETHAIDATNVLGALKQGRAIDLSGVVIRGDLILDTLPVSPGLPVLEGVAVQQGGEVRVIPGAVSIVRSIVRGPIKHQSAQGLLVFSGPLSFAGTRFEQAVDLSRSVFTQPVTLSGAVFLRESFFVQGRFLRGVVSEKTAFGPHTRFHRSQFQGPVTFQQSGFSGMAEFLEVVFERDADFSRTYFKLGTGFSGGHFKGMADFSEALFDREAFFTFTRFDGDAYFRRATFRSTADFDDTQFNAREDFSKVFFEKGPQFARAKRSADGPEILGIENAKVQYAITLSLLVFSVVLIAYLIRSR
jgi:hypothetical protein